MLQQEPTLAEQLPVKPENEDVDDGEDRDKGPGHWFCILQGSPGAPR